jgi:methionyl-tRNA formyltransferase
LDDVDCSTLLTGIESIEVKPVGKKFIHKELGVLLRFGFNILSGEILTVARYGVWSYHHGDNDYYRGGPPHFWELVERRSHLQSCGQGRSD